MKILNIGDTVHVQADKTWHKGRIINIHLGTKAMNAVYDVQMLDTGIISVYLEHELHLTEGRPVHTFNAGDVVWTNTPVKRMATIEQINTDASKKTRFIIIVHETGNRLPCYSDGILPLTPEELDRYRTDTRRKLKIRLLKKKLSIS